MARGPAELAGVTASKGPPAHRATMPLVEAGRLLGLHALTVSRYIDQGYLEGQRMPSGFRRVYRDSVITLWQQLHPEESCDPSIIGQLGHKRQKPASRSRQRAKTPPAQS